MKIIKGKISLERQTYSKSSKSTTYKVSGKVKRQK